MICDESSVTTMGLAMVDVILTHWIFSIYIHNIDRDGLNRVQKRHVMYF